MKETKLIIARHGNTFNKGDVILRVGARTDLPLTHEGLAQGMRLGKNLLNAGLIPTRFFSAPLKRTVTTCTEAAKALGIDVSPQLVDFLTELDYGEYDGLPESEVVRKIGLIESATLGINQNAKSNEEIDELGRQALRRWDQNQKLPTAWSFLQSRVNALEENWKEFAEQITIETPGETCLITTSNGVARFALSLLPHGSQIPEIVKLSTGAYSLFVQTGKTWTLEAWNVR